MIQICVRKHDSCIKQIQITGHANTAEYGNDLVCAAVSAIAFGLCNALDQICHSQSINIKDNLISIDSDDEYSSEEQVILNTGLIQFQTVEEVNKKSVKIIQLEV